METTITRGVLFIHSAPAALVPHIESAVCQATGQDLSLRWLQQPAEPGKFRSELSWTGEYGTGVRIASALRGWEHLRYEVTEQATPTTDAGRWAHTPSLGIFHSHMDSAGNIVIPEDRVRAALENATTLDELREQLELALGQAWDDELEIYRHAGAGAPVRFINTVQVG